jgi:hypothetical protein
VAQVCGLCGRADRDRNPVLVTKDDFARIATKPFLSRIVGPALAGRLARDSRFAVFLAALRLLPPCACSGLPGLPVGSPAFSILLSSWIPP